jgi:hypothetical protein
VSADNFIGVYKRTSDDYWIVCHGFMTILDENEMYRGSFVSAHVSKQDALEDALSRARYEIVEYGVIELEERRL